ncbi:hypothetical protein AJ79_07657 [Helicocarpus griseus UAMH5409]|uniref:Copper acquisition factor BIM1-like domain-containing protein n=1 Tax=Helicocarpus griseus UAMH5409 TaxID=1447875 RepID=A0A2B7X0W9_9EURO|nr:hypothetical protein AJ79_07657 [Helicocarpus griseus UAMH5409]
MAALLIGLALLLKLTSAHFSVEYPYWRGDSYSTQYTRPCGGVNVTNNRTQWPLDGGSILFSPSHPWAITYINLGLGSDDTVIFNISLIENFNQTGNGTLCFPKVNIPPELGLTAGSHASIQVIQLSELGSALYNCADITFSENAELLSTDKCANSSGIGWEPLGAAASTPPDTGVGYLTTAYPTFMYSWLSALVFIWLWN